MLLFFFLIFDYDMLRKPTICCKLMATEVVIHNRCGRLLNVVW